MQKYAQTGTSGCRLLKIYLDLRADNCKPANVVCVFANPHGALWQAINAANGDGLDATIYHDGVLIPNGSSIADLRQSTSTTSAGNDSTAATQANPLQVRTRHKREPAPVPDAAGKSDILSGKRARSGANGAIAGPQAAQAAPVGALALSAGTGVLSMRWVGMVPGAVLARAPLYCC